MRARFPLLLSLAAAAALPRFANANSPIVVMNEAGFEGLEEPTVLYFPDTNTFQTGDTFQNHVDEGGSMFRDILRNNYSTLGWWDGDGADTTRTDRQRSEPKGIVGLGHQQVEQTFEYSFDFRTNPGFQATGSFCHIFQLKATNGDDGAPLATISLYKNGSGIQGRIDCFTDGLTGNQTETHPATFSYTAGQWIHFVIRITPCAQGESTGQELLSVNGSPFTGTTNAAIDLSNSTDFRPKFGFYRGISTTNGVPAGDSWVEHRTITGYQGTSNVLTWAGGQNNNTWDNAATPNFLNAVGNTTSTFNTIDQVNFTGTANTTINLAGNLWPGFTDVNSSANYTFQAAAGGGPSRAEPSAKTAPAPSPSPPSTPIPASPTSETAPSSSPAPSATTPSSPSPAAPSNSALPTPLAPTTSPPQREPRSTAAPSISTASPSAPNPSPSRAQASPATAPSSTPAPARTPPCPTLP